MVIMATIHHPYQCIATIHPTTESTFILAACGPKLSSLNVASGTVVSEWGGESAVSSLLP